MTNPKRISVGPVGEHIALARWGEDGSGKPPALLLHGTGFVAEVWDEVARELAAIGLLEGVLCALRVVKLGGSDIEGDVIASSNMGASAGLTFRYAGGCVSSGGRLRCARRIAA